MTDPKTAQQQARDLLHNGVMQIMTSEGWQQALRFRSQFHTYSFFNTLLILSQFPTASLICGYRKWQELNRQVVKGQKDISILAPLLRKDKDDPERRVLYGFRQVKVFDISQTDGEPAPTAPRPTLLEGNNQLIARTIEALERFCDGRGINVNRDLSHPRALGSFNLLDHSISLKPDMPALQELKTLVHELGHALLHDQAVDRIKAELEAETTAFLTLHQLGLDTSSYSFSYLANWTDSRENLIAAGGNASKAATTLLTHINQHLEATTDQATLVQEILRVVGCRGRTAVH